MADIGARNIWDLLNENPTDAANSQHGDKVIVKKEIKTEGNVWSPPVNDVKNEELMSSVSSQHAKKKGKGQRTTRQVTSKAAQGNKEGMSAPKKSEDRTLLSGLAKLKTRLKSSGPVEVKQEEPEELQVVTEDSTMKTSQGSNVNQARSNIFEMVPSLLDQKMSPVKDSEKTSVDMMLKSLYKDNDIPLMSFKKLPSSCEDNDKNKGDNSESVQGDKNKADNSRNVQGDKNKADNNKNVQGDTSEYKVKKEKLDDGYEKHVDSLKLTEDSDKMVAIVDTWEVNDKETEKVVARNKCQKGSTTAEESSSEIAQSNDLVLNEKTRNNVSDQKSVELKKTSVRKSPRQRKKVSKGDDWIETDLCFKKSTKSSKASESSNESLSEKDQKSNNTLSIKITKSKGNYEKEMTESESAFKSLYDIRGAEPLLVEDDNESETKVINNEDGNLKKGKSESRLLDKSLNTASSGVELLEVNRNVASTSAKTTPSCENTALCLLQKYKLNKDKSCDVQDKAGLSNGRKCGTRGKDRVSRKQKGKVKKDLAVSDSKLVSDADSEIPSTEQSESESEQNRLKSISSEVIMTEETQDLRSLSSRNMNEKPFKNVDLKLEESEKVKLVKLKDKRTSVDTGSDMPLDLSLKKDEDQSNEKPKDEMLSKVLLSVSPVKPILQERIKRRSSERDGIFNVFESERLRKISTEESSIPKSDSTPKLQDLTEEKSSSQGSGILTSEHLPNISAESHINSSSQNLAALPSVTQGTCSISSDIPVNPTKPDAFISSAKSLFNSSDCDSSKCFSVNRAINLGSVCNERCMHQKKRIMAEVKPNNAAVLTVPSSPEKVVPQVRSGGPQSKQKKKSEIRHLEPNKNIPKLGTTFESVSNLNNNVTVCFASSTVQPNVISDCSSSESVKISRPYIYDNKKVSKKDENAGKSAQHSDEDLSKLSDKADLLKLNDRRTDLLELDDKTGDMTEIKSKDVPNESIETVDHSKMCKSKDGPNESIETVDHSKMCKSQDVPNESIETVDHSKMCKSQDVPNESIEIVDHSKMCKSQDVPNESIETVDHSKMCKSQDVPNESIETVDHSKMCKSNDVPNEIIETVDHSKMSKDVPKEIIETVDHSKMSKDVPKEIIETVDHNMMCKSNDIPDETIETVDHNINVAKEQTDKTEDSCMSVKVETISPSDQICDDSDNVIQLDSSIDENKEANKDAEQSDSNRMNVLDENSDHCLDGGNVGSRLLGSDKERDEIEKDKADESSTAKKDLKLAPIVLDIEPSTDKINENHRNASEVIDAHSSKVKSNNVMEKSSVNEMCDTDGTTESKGNSAVDLDLQSPVNNIDSFKTKTNPPEVLDETLQLLNVNKDKSASYSRESILSNESEKVETAGKVETADSCETKVRSRAENASVVIIDDDEEDEEKDDILVVENTQLSNKQSDNDSPIYIGVTHTKNRKPQNVPTSIRRSSRPLKPSVKILEQMQFENLDGFEDFLATDTGEKSLPVGVSCKIPRKNRKSELKADSETKVKQETSVDKTGTYASGNIVNEEVMGSNKILNKDLDHETIDVKKETNVTSGIQLKETTEKSVDEMEKVESDIAEIKPAIGKYVQKGGNRSEVIVIDEDVADKKPEKKIRSDPSAFQPISEFSKSVTDKKDQFYSVYKVPLKVRKKMKQFRLWKKRNASLSNLLASVSSELDMKSFKYGSPSDTDIRVKELKLGQSWKDHLFDHKTKVLKIPPALVYIPKTEPENLSFDVPQKFIVKKEAESSLNKIGTKLSNQDSVVHKKNFDMKVNVRSTKTETKSFMKEVGIKSGITKIAKVKEKPGSGIGKKSIAINDSKVMTGLSTVIDIPKRQYRRRSSPRSDKRTANFINASSATTVIDISRGTISKKRNQLKMSTLENMLTEANNIAAVPYKMNIGQSSTTGINKAINSDVNKQNAASNFITKSSPNHHHNQPKNSKADFITNANNTGANNQINNEAVNTVNSTVYGIDPPGKSPPIKVIQPQGNSPPVKIIQPQEYSPPIKVIQPQEYSPPIKVIEVVPRPMIPRIGQSDSIVSPNGLNADAASSSVLQTVRPATKTPRPGKSSLPAVKNYSTPANKDIRNVIEFGQILRKSESESQNNVPLDSSAVLPLDRTSIYPLDRPEAVPLFEPIVIEPETDKRTVVRNKPNTRKAQLNKITQQDILKQKVIRKLTGQAPVVPVVKSGSPKKIFIKGTIPMTISERSDISKGIPLAVGSGDGLTGVSVPILPQGMASLSIPGLKTYSVEMVEVQHMPSANGDQVYVMSSVASSDNETTTLLSSSQNFDQSTVNNEQNNNTTENETCATSSGPVCVVKGRDLDTLSAINHEVSPVKFSPGGDSDAPIIIEDNADADTTLSYEDLPGDKIEETLFDDLLDETSEDPLMFEGTDTTGMSNEDNDQENSQITEHNTSESSIAVVNVSEITKPKRKVGSKNATVISCSKDSPAKSTRSTKSNSAGKQKNGKSNRKSQQVERKSTRQTKSPAAGQVKAVTTSSKSPSPPPSPPKATNTKKEPDDTPLNHQQRRKSSTSEERKKPSHKRNMLDELKSSDGFIADKIKKKSDSLFDDPGQLTREEKALQRAIMNFSEMEYKKAMKAQRVKDNVQKKANQIKKKAVQHSKKREPGRFLRQFSRGKKGFVDFQPVILEKRTRFEWFHPARGKKGFVDFQPVILEKRTRFEWFHPAFNSTNEASAQTKSQNNESSKNKETSKYLSSAAASTSKSFKGKVSSGKGLLSKSKPPVKSATVSRKRKSEDEVNVDGNEWESGRFASSPTKKLRLPPEPSRRKSKASVEEEENPWSHIKDCQVRVVLTDEESLPDLEIKQEISMTPAPKKNISPRKSGSKGKAKRKSMQRIKSYVEEEPPLSFMDSLVSNIGGGGPRPMIYIDRADVPSPCAQPPAIEPHEDLPSFDLDNNELLSDQFDTMSMSTTFSVEGSRVKIPPEVKKISVNRDSGENVLHKAARLGYKDVVLWCCQTGYADPGGLDYAGFAPLHECCAAGQIEIAKILLAYGADINVASKKDGVRPLHDAIESDHIEMVRLVMSVGGDPKLATYSGRTIYDMIRSNEMKEFLDNYRMDLEELSSKPWQFRDFVIDGEESDDEDLGQDIFTNLPPDEDTDVDEVEEVLFECFDQPTIPVYNLKKIEIYEGPYNYALLLDILQTLGMTKLEFTRQLDSRIFTITWQEFARALESSQITVPCKWLPEAGRKRKLPVDLVKWDARFQELFGVEEIVVKSYNDTRDLLEMNSDKKQDSNVDDNDDDEDDSLRKDLRFTPPKVNNKQSFENERSDYKWHLKYSHLSSYMNSDSDGSGYGSDNDKKKRKRRLTNGNSKLKKKQGVTKLNQLNKTEMFGSIFDKNTSSNNNNNTQRNETNIWNPLDDNQVNSIGSGKIISPGKAMKKLDFSNNSSDIIKSNWSKPDVASSDRTKTVNTGLMKSLVGDSKLPSKPYQGDSRSNLNLSPSVKSDDKGIFKPSSECVSNSSQSHENMHLSPCYSQSRIDNNQNWEAFNITSDSPRYATDDVLAMQNVQKTSPVSVQSRLGATKNPSISPFSINRYGHEFMKNTNSNNVQAMGNMEPLQRSPVEQSALYYPEMIRNEKQSGGFKNRPTAIHRQPLVIQPHGSQANQLMVDPYVSPPIDSYGSPPTLVRNEPHITPLKEVGGGESLISPTMPVICDPRLSPSHSQIISPFHTSSSSTASHLTAFSSPPHSGLPMDTSSPAPVHPGPQNIIKSYLSNGPHGFSNLQTGSDLRVGQNSSMHSGHNNLQMGQGSNIQSGHKNLQMGQNSLATHSGECNNFLAQPQPRDYYRNSIDHAPHSVLRSPLKSSASYSGVKTERLDNNPCATPVDVYLNTNHPHVHSVNSVNQPQSALLDRSLEQTVSHRTLPYTHNQQKGNANIPMSKFGTMSSSSFSNLPQESWLSNRYNTLQTNQPSLLQTDQHSPSFNDHQKSSLNNDHRKSSFNDHQKSSLNDHRKSSFNDHQKSSLNDHQKSSLYNDQHSVSSDHHQHAKSVNVQSGRSSINPRQINRSFDDSNVSFNDCSVDNPDQYPEQGESDGNILLRIGQVMSLSEGADSSFL